MQQAHRDGAARPGAVRGRWGVLGCALALAASIVGPVMVGVSTAAPAAATPGAAAAPTVVYTEDFEAHPAPTPVLRLNQYTGTSGQAYTADAPWLKDCNGWIAAAQQPLNGAAQVADCQGIQRAWNGVQQMSQAIGMFHGQSVTAARANHAVSALTLADTPRGSVEFATSQNVPLPTSARFLAFSVDVAASACNLAHPLLQFYLLNDAAVAIPAGGQIDGCSSPTQIAVPALGANPATTVTVGTYATDGAVLFTGSSVGIRMVNNQPNSNGNDHSFDNVRILDVTPQLDKQFVGGWGRTGGTARLQFTVTNTGELGAKPGWSFQDALPPGMTVASPSNASTTCPAGNLAAAGTQVSMTGSLTTGMASCTVDVDVTAATSGPYVNGPDRVSVVGLNPPAPATVTFSSPSIALTKTAGTPIDVNGDGLVDAGDIIPYTFSVQNTGDVPLSNATVNDPSVSPIAGCPIALLPVGGRATCTASYVITTADEAAGAVVNTATASGSPPLPAPLVVSPPSSTRTPVTAPRPSINLVKSASPLKLVEGETITYSFELENTGNLPLSTVQVREQAFTGSGTLSPVTCPSTTLAIGQQLVCQATYQVTAHDLLAGTIDNTAIATGVPPGVGAAPVASPPSSVVLPGMAAPKLTATKSVSPDLVHAAGDTVTYTMAVENTGNISIQGLTIHEDTFSGTGAVPVFLCADTTLVPGQHTSCVASYTLTQADIDTASVDNTARALGSLADSTPVSSPTTTAALTVDATSALDLVKSADAQSITHAGQVVTYDFAVTNTGARTIHGLAVQDASAPPGGPLDGAPSCPLTVLAPRQTTTCSADYTVSQADIDHGSISDTATASGSGPTGGTVASPPASLALPSTAVAALSIVKSADASSIRSAGELVTFGFVVTNTGEVTVSGVAVDDAPVAPAQRLVASPTCADTSLAPRASTHCTAEYVVTQEDIDHGSLADEATARATAPDGDTVSSSPDGLSIPSTATSSLDITGETSGTITTVGQDVPYTFTVTNTGETTISGVAIVSSLRTTTDCEPSTLAPGESATCTGAHVVSQDDLDAGHVIIAGVATGTTPAGGAVDSPEETLIVHATDQTASMTLVKTATSDTTVFGSSIHYVFTVRNTGTLTLYSLTIGDSQAPPAGPIDVPPVCDQTDLAPGETATCIATYVPTLDDLRRGSVADTAVAHATTLAGDPVASDPATLTVTVQAPAQPIVAEPAGPTASAGVTGTALPSTGSDVTPGLLVAASALLLGAALRPVRRILGRPRISLGDSRTHSPFM